MTGPSRALGVPAAAGLRLLTIDCGNSTIDCRRSADGARQRFDAASPDRDALLQFVRAQPIDRCLAVSVAPAALASVEHTLQHAALSVELAGRELPCPLRLDYSTPETLGADRWVGALGAFCRFGAAVVVDCGTATTVNVVDASATFRGGAVAPGLRAFVHGMRALTPALPEARLDAEPVLPAKSSQDAVDTGVLLGYAGMVERLVAAALRAMSSATVVVTGGNAARLLRATRLQPVHDDALVHRGLELLIGASPCT